MIDLSLEMPSCQAVILNRLINVAGAIFCAEINQPLAEKIQEW
jgi:hypothetical protein